MYNLKIIQSGKRLELYRYNGYTVSNKGDNFLGEVFMDTKEPGEKINDIRTKEDRRAETLNIARNNIIRLVNSNEDMQTFLTLTFSNDSICDYKESKQLLNNFFTKLRRDYKGLKYLWVLEYGSLNNRLHYHILTNIPIQINLSRSNEKKSHEHKELENYFRIKYWVHGWVDIRHLGQEENTRIGVYISCYITKDLIGKQLEGYRIYGYSRKTLNKPTEVKEYTTESLEEVLYRFSTNYKVKYSSSYEIGYTSNQGEYKGIVLYLDLIRMED